MLLIFDDVDQGGKTTLAKKAAEYLGIQYIKLNNINIRDNEYVKDGVSISTHSQLETVLQLYEKGVIKDAILDRFHISEYVYSNLFNRPYDTNYVMEIENRLSKLNDIFIIRCVPNYRTLEKRWKENEKLINVSLLPLVVDFYEKWFTFNSRHKPIKINTDSDASTSFAELVFELNKRGISPGHPRVSRATHIETMMEMAKVLSKRSPDISRQVGAILTEDGFIVGCGYNGPPSGFNHDEIDIRKERGFESGKGLEYSRSIHAEQNAIMQSGLRSKSQGKLELFCTTSPCIHCTRMLLQIGVSTIYYLDKYNDEMAEMMWKEAGIEVVKL